MHYRLTTPRLLMTITAMLIFAACGGSGGGDAATSANSDASVSSTSVPSITGPQADWYSSALEETSLGWYTNMGQANVDRTVEAFSEKYSGLTVEGLSLSSGQIVERFASERDANAALTDIISMGDKLFAAEALENGWFLEFEKDEIPAIAELDDRWFNRGIVVPEIRFNGIGYNTELVEDPPQDWPEVLDPKYRGKIVWVDYRNAPVYADQATLWLDLYGEEFFHDLKAQEVTFTDSSSPMIQMLGSGQAEITLTTSTNGLLELKEQGAPVDMVYPDAVVGTESLTAISSTTESPNAAKLFLDFLMSSEGQEVYVGGAAASPIGAPGSMTLPEGFTSNDQERFAEVIDLLQSIFQLP